MTKAVFRPIITAFATSAVVASLSVARSQVVFVGHQDPKYCQKVERIRPNLILRQSTHVYGLITDVVESPLVRQEVVLRSWLSQANQQTVRSLSTDDFGRFDFGKVEPGRYRLLASATRGFRQPGMPKCQDGTQCDLEIKLVAPPHTDGPDSICPVK
jgi:hypothetical protein